MGVNTQGLIDSKIKTNDILEVLVKKFDIVAKTEKVLWTEDYYKIFFDYNGENRVLSVFENYTDLNHTGFEIITLIDLNLWGSSIELIRGIVEEFGGYMVENDCNDDWIPIQKIK